DPELAMSCIGASWESVQAARKTKGPHAHTGIVIYMNDAAARTFAGKTGAYEPGAVIVKEKSAVGYREPVTGKFVHDASGVGGMVKRSPGFDPAHGDWEYFYFEDAKKIESGHISTCVQCHSSAKSKDYIFGT